MRAEYRGSFGGAYLKGPFHWQVSYFSKNGKKEIGQVIIDDLSGRVLEQWTGFQVAWTMARGYPGAFGRHVNALYIWLPLCVLFVLPFFNFRRPFSLLHLDLLVLLSFSVSLAFFNHGQIYSSVPLSLPAAAVPARAHARAAAAAGAARGGPREPGPLRLLVPAPWLALGVVFLIGFRIALNVTDSNVIDVGYAGVIGAQRIVDGKPLYGHWPSDNEHGDTYGPVNYEAYVPFEQVFGWSGKWDDLPAAHAAAIVFDLLAHGAAVPDRPARARADARRRARLRVGRRTRSRCSRWRATPTTRSSPCSCSPRVLAATYRSKLAAPARGAVRGARRADQVRAARARAAARDPRPVGSRRGAVRARARRATSRASRSRSPRRSRVTCIPALSHDSLHTIYERTLAYQSDRGSPFSVWGLYGGLRRRQAAVQIAAVALAVALARDSAPRRPRRARRRRARR